MESIEVKPRFIADEIPETTPAPKGFSDTINENKLLIFSVILNVICIIVLAYLFYSRDPEQSAPQSAVATVHQSSAAQQIHPQSSAAQQIHPQSSAAQQIPHNKHHPVDVSPNTLPGIPQYTREQLQQLRDKTVSELAVRRNPQPETAVVVNEVEDPQSDQEEDMEESNQQLPVSICGELTTAGTPCKNKVRGGIHCPKHSGQISI